MRWAPVRVCYVTESFYPPDTGGLQRHAHELARRLAARGAEVSVITRRVDATAPERETIGGVAVRRLPPAGQWKGRGWRALAPLAGFLGRVLALLAREAAGWDVVLVGGLKLIPLPAMAVCLARGKGCVIRVETPTELSEDLTAESVRRMRLGPAAAALRAFRAGRNALVRRASRVIAPSSEVREALLRIGVEPRRIRLIPYGIDVARFRPAPAAEKPRLRRELGLPEPGVLVAFTGRLAVSKGLPGLIRVWDDLVRARPDLHLVLVGSAGGTFDACEDDLRAYVAERGIEGTVTFAGEVENVHRYLQAADVFVFPSEYESFGMAIVEAMACGLPSVVTRVGVAPEQIVDGENGLLVEPGNVAGLRVVLGSLLDHPERWGAMGAAARRAVEDRYGMDDVADSHFEVLREVAAEHGRARAPQHAAA